MLGKLGGVDTPKAAGLLVLGALGALIVLRKGFPTLRIGD